MKTKIIATYGPALENAGVLGKALKYADIIRINFSHGSKAKWSEYVDTIRHEAKRSGRKTLLLADLPGPKIRFGKITREIEVKPGDEIIIGYNKKGAIPIEYDISAEARRGSTILVGDGYLKLSISKVRKGLITCRALNNGRISSKKGVSMSGMRRIVSPTPEDMELAEFAKSEGFDWIGLSFATSAAGVKSLRSRTGIPVVSKIESTAALSNLEEIVKASDAVMVARGDLALDIGIENIPEAQRDIISECARFEKPVIVATEMLASMVSRAMPTRAEVNDIANAIWAGASYLMLSEETAVGSYPVEALEMLYNTASVAEHAPGMRHWSTPRL